MEYPWYEYIESSKDIQQGDFIPDCPLYIPPAPPKEGDKLSISLQIIDSIILSQSCDLANGKIDIVLVCSYLTLKRYIELAPQEMVSPKKTLEKTLENLRQGIYPGYHLLEKEEKQIKDYIVVDFRNVYGIHIESLRDICASLDLRPRLLPPYREHLSQAFARFFMRVGLPQDIKITGY